MIFDRIMMIFESDSFYLCFNTFTDRIRRGLHEKKDFYYDPLL